MARVLSLLFALFLLLPLGRSQAVPAIPAAPQTVHVGALVLDVGAVDVKAGTFVLDFYLYFRWKGKFDPTRFEIMNGVVDNLGPPDEEIMPDGTRHAAFRVRATVRAQMNLERYPWDEQVLPLEIEDTHLDARRMRYVADPDSALQGDATIPSYKITGIRTEAKTYQYASNLGDPSLRKGERLSYSRFILEIRARHSGAAVYLKAFLPLIISVAIAFLTFFIRVDALDPRFGVGIAGIFGAVSSHILVAGNLPEHAAFTMADRIHQIGLFSIFLSIAASAISLAYFNRGEEARAARLDRWCAWIFPALFTVAVWWVSKG